MKDTMIETKRDASNVMIYGVFGLFCVFFVMSIIFSLIFSFLTDGKEPMQMIRESQTGVVTDINTKSVTVEVDNTSRNIDSRKFVHNYHVDDKIDLVVTDNYVCPFESFKGCLRLVNVSWMLTLGCGIGCLASMIHIAAGKE